MGETSPIRSPKFDTDNDDELYKVSGLLAGLVRSTK